MPVSEEYTDFVRDLLAGLEPLRIRRMFGGVGIYSGELFFAILVDDMLYFKVDDSNRGAYEGRGLCPFSYETKSARRGTMSYYPVPSDVLEEPEALDSWARAALEVARRAAARKPVSERSKPKRPGK